MTIVLLADQIANAIGKYCETFCDCPYIPILYTTESELYQYINGICVTSTAFAVCFGEANGKVEFDIPCGAIVLSPKSP